MLQSGEGRGDPPLSQGPLYLENHDKWKNSIVQTAQRKLQLHFFHSDLPKQINTQLYLGAWGYCPVHYIKVQEEGGGGGFVQFKDAINS